MQNDLDKQKKYAQTLADELTADLGGEEIAQDLTADLILDILGICGLTLQPGTDAGKAWLDDIMNETKQHTRHR